MSLFFYLTDGYLLGMGAWLAGMIASLVFCLKQRRSSHQSPRKLKWIHAGISIWMLLATLTALELYCALFVDQTDSFSLTNISKRWALRHERKNLYGFRDLAQFPKIPPDGRRRIAFTGDSFAFGHGVVDEQDRFSDRIAASLERRQPGRFFVNNIAMPGVDTPGIVRVTKDILADGFKIDTLVYAFCLNDIEYLNHERTDEAYRQITIRKPTFFLFRDTYFFNLVYFRYKLFTQPEVRGYFSFLHSYYEGETWLEMQDLLDELVDKCAQYQIDLRIVIFPFLHNLGPDYPFHPAHQKMIEYCQSKKIRVLDLEPVLTPHVAEGLTVNRFDAHPNVRAHQLAADAIEKQLLNDLFQTSP